MTAVTNQQRFTQHLVEQALAEGVELVDPDGLLTRLTKNVLEAALEAKLGLASTRRAVLTGCRSVAFEPDYAVRMLLDRRRIWGLPGRDVSHLHPLNIIIAQRQFRWQLDGLAVRPQVAPVSPVDLGLSDALLVNIDDEKRETHEGQ